MRSVMCAIFGDSRRTIVFSSARIALDVLLVLRSADLTEVREHRPGLSGDGRHFVFEQGHHVVRAVGQRRQAGRNLSLRRPLPAIAPTRPGQGDGRCCCRR